jgi:hypothetical protein
VEVLAESRNGAAAREFPILWLDSFCMRSFTGRAAFDDTLPVADGKLEIGFDVDLAALRTDMEDWMTRKCGEGKQVKLQVTEIPSVAVTDQVRCSQREVVMSPATI